VIFEKDDPGRKDEECCRLEVDGEKQDENNCC
jgi:hypothetical protein